MAVITISKQLGAGWLTLGRMVAEQLNYALLDEEIMLKVASETKVSVNWVSRMEKEARGRFARPREDRPITQPN